MIELPRAALKADELAQSAEFFGFGTNDLTQTTLGMSRDDTGAILDEYRARGVMLQIRLLLSTLKALAAWLRWPVKKPVALTRKSGWVSAVNTVAIRHLSISSRLVA